MNLQGITAVVTGAARGIGAALVAELKARGAGHVAASDIAGDMSVLGADSTHICDVSDAEQMRAMIEKIEDAHGPIDLFCSNAGILNGTEGSFENAAGAPEEDWQRAWGVNVMAHVHAAKVLIPTMKARGGGYFLQTASAAGLLSQIGSAAYATTKHAAVGFAEALALTHKDDGIRVSVLCPQGVMTDMIRGEEHHPAAMDGILSAEDVAKAGLDGVEEERFLILPHENVATYMRHKLEDHDRWIGGMAKLQRHYLNKG